MKISPTNDELAISNHRNELMIVNLRKNTLHKVDKSKFSLIRGFNWSPDGNFLAYSCSYNSRVNGIKIYGFVFK